MSPDGERVQVVIWTSGLNLWDRPKATTDTGEQSASTLLNKVGNDISCLSEDRFHRKIPYQHQETNLLGDSGLHECIFYSNIIKCLELHSLVSSL